MSKLLVASLLLYGAVAVCAEDKYPAAFPFEKEGDRALVDVELPTATPNNKMDADDEGGYATLMSKCDVDALYKTTGPKGFSLVDCPGFEPAAKHIYKVSASDVRGSSRQNCTKQVAQFGVDSIYAVYMKLGLSFKEGLQKGFNDKGETDEDWCKDEENCCNEFTKFASIPNPDALYQSKLNRESWMNQAKTNQCSGSNLNYYCLRMFPAISHCQENFLSPTKRDVVLPCYDTEIHFYASCKVISKDWATAKSATDASSLVFEPQKWLEKASMLQFHTSRSIQRFPDKVCKPYSYYHPATAKKLSPTSTNVTKPEAPAQSSSTPSSAKAAPTPSSTKAASTSEKVVVAETTSGTSPVLLLLPGLSLVGKLLL